MYVSYYTIFVFLFLSYFTLYNRHYRFIHLTTTDSNLFIFMAE